MPDWSAVVAIAGFLLGGGGIAALWRTRSQNRVDERSQLTNEQVKFRQDMAAEMSSLRTEISNLKEANRKLDDRNDELIKENGDLKGRVRFLEEQNADLKNRILNADAEKYTMQRELEQLKQSVRGIERRESQAA